MDATTHPVILLTPELIGPRAEPTIFLDTLVIYSGGVYAGYDVNSVVVLTSEPVVLTDSVVHGGGAAYAVDATGYYGRADTHDWSNLRIEYCRINGDTGGKGILGGDYLLYRSDVAGGEDGLHINRGTVYVNRSIIREQVRSSGGHHDGIQLSGGGDGGRLIIAHSRVQGSHEEETAALQINVASADVISCNNLYSGGTYTVYCDPDDSPATFRSSGDLFAYETAKFGEYTGRTAVAGPMHHSRLIVPRVSTPKETPAFESPSYPGDFAPF